MTWYGEYITVQLNPENISVTYAMTTYRLLYINDTALQVAVANIDGRQHNITMTFYDYYDPDHNITKQYVVEDTMSDTVGVWSNKTVVRIRCDGEEYGLILVSNYANTEMAGLIPPEFKNIVPLIPVALLIALAGRGDPRDGGLGLIVYSIVAPWLAEMGFDARALAVSSTISFVLGALIVFKSR